MEEYDERADALEREADRLEHETKRVGEKIGETRNEWEAKQSASDAPGAVDAESAGPHNIDEEDPATGRSYGQEERTEEFDAAEREDAESGDTG
jgi:hypothetical protein